MQCYAISYIIKKLQNVGKFVKFLNINLIKLINWLWNKSDCEKKTVKFLKIIF